NMNGEEKINETTINPAIVDQRIVGLTISITDITRKEIEGKRQRNELREMQKLGSEIDNFLYGVSHDLRAPLLSIISVIKIMNRDYVKDMSLLDTIETTVKRLDNFVTNVITYSREHQVGISADEIDFEKTISSVIDSLTYLENSKFVRYSCVINQEVPFLSDRNRLSSILRNTFASVFQHLDFSENPKVKITIEVEPSAATIQLEESRENTSLQVRQDVFESFFGGADNTTGSGLAFYLVKNMIEKLGGRILLKSSHGIGSGVILKLPNLRSTNY
ncbi:MAG TPA: HAMP domain-containing sensor histidine kinase, partial [Sphingobacteriaceae bacterium]